MWAVQNATLTAFTKGVVSEALAWLSHGPELTTRAQPCRQEQMGRPRRSTRRSPSSSSIHEDDFEESFDYRGGSDNRSPPAGWTREVPRPMPPPADPRQSLASDFNVTRLSFKDLPPVSTSLPASSSSSLAAPQFFKGRPRSSTGDWSNLPAQTAPWPPAPRSVSPRRSYFLKPYDRSLPPRSYSQASALAERQEGEEGRLSAPERPLLPGLPGALQTKTSEFAFRSVIEPVPKAFQSESQLVSMLAERNSLA